jgi:hypothetical protein
MEIAMRYCIETDLKAAAVPDELESCHGREQFRLLKFSLLGSFYKKKKIQPSNKGEM